jgi:hypothetical protein
MPTAEAWQEVIGYLTRTYGDDITQQALYVTLQRTRRQPIAFVKTVAKRLAQRGHSDARTNARRTWWREQVSLLTHEAGPMGLWMLTPMNPLAVAEDREVLRALPAFIREWHLAYAFQFKRNCGHDWSWFYPRISGIKRSVCCRLCDRQAAAEQTAGQRRARVRRTHPISHITR